jgi:hypothetical protein
MKSLTPISRHLPIPRLHRANIQQLLLLIGMPRQRLYVRNNKQRLIGTFWNRCGQQLETVLHDARVYYLDGIKKVHPDHGGSARRAATLNVAWQRIQKLFAQRGARL